MAVSTTKDGRDLSKIRRVSMAKISAMRRFSGAVHSQASSGLEKPGGGKVKKSDSFNDKEDGAAKEELPADLAALKVTIEKLQQVRKLKSVELVLDSDRNLFQARSEIVIPEKEPLPQVPVKMKKLKPASERNKQPLDFFNNWVMF